MGFWGIEGWTPSTASQCAKIRLVLLGIEGGLVEKLK